MMSFKVGRRFFPFGRTLRADATKLRPAEGGRFAEAYVIGEDEQDIRRAFRGLDHLGTVLDGFPGRATNLADECLFRPGQDFSRP